MSTFEHLDRDTPSPVVLAVVDGIRDAADQLTELSRRLEAGLASGVTPTRLLMLSAPLLAQLAAAEREAHRLSAFAIDLPKRPAAE